MEYENSSIEVVVDNCESINEGNCESINEGVDNFEGINEGVSNFEAINEGEDNINENEEDENLVIDFEQICEEVENVVNEGRVEVFDNHPGGYERLSFCKKDIYNKIGRQRRLEGLDSKSALEFLNGLKCNDPLMYVGHTVDDENKLQHLFWCDGMMQMEYEVFGDVLAFDATYGKNKYLCPVVVFSCVNHHNHMIVFGSAIVSNETEETYIWVLEQFVEAMKGKSPMSIITDGDVAMKNSIRKVFPNSHHRLCAWHLLRNATTNIKKPTFTKDLRKCMLGEYEIGEFRKKWSEMLNKFELHDHPWVIELFEKRKIWCTTYIRGAFFAGFRQLLGVKDYILS
ncbi:protein FAR1-RELATED SEQUENCE 5-like [Cajanus cajan]|uniref:protein FAR1-RELATED SEQUENCE 5-like n=1 Tax=Cajanus cajan TaxID=3821 RepID=UPI00098D9C4C|nr:protein FAR1-RELATED SEQUENCE 5-like [Cajanus cajan]